MKRIALPFKMKDSPTIKAEQKALVLFPVLFILVCYERQNKMWKIRNLVYCLQGWNNCMPWVRSLVEVRQVQQEPLPNRN